MEIQHPCPMALSQVQNEDGSFSCHSCKRGILDFTKLPADVVESYRGKGYCGVLRADQLPEQKNYSGWNKYLFIGLTWLSILGVSVKPMKAQTTEPVEIDTVRSHPEDEREVTVYSVSDPEVKDSSAADKRRERRLQRRHRKMVRRNAVYFGYF